MNAGIQLGESFVPHPDVLQHALRGASGLAELGVRKGDSVAIVMRNDPVFIEATFAARILGAYPVPINWHLHGEEVRYILDDSDAKILVIHEDLYPTIKEWLPDGLSVILASTPRELKEAFGISMPAPVEKTGLSYWSEWLNEQTPWEKPPEAEVSSMIYTSGTTGHPKGVRRNAPTPEQHEGTIRMLQTIFDIKPGIRTIIPAPVYHSAPNAYGILATQLEGFVVLMPRFDPEEFLRLVEQHRITHVQMVPVMFVRLLKLPEPVRKKYDVSSLEYIVHAAAPCPPDVKKEMIDWWGPIIHEYYGSTEMGAVTLCNSEDALSHPGTVGKPLLDARIRVLNEEGQDVSQGEIGTIYTRLPFYPDFTYQKDSGKRANIEREGLITGGDMGYFDEDGFLHLCDRSTDMIISGGVNIYPAEIESVLIGLQGVRDCAVFGIPDEEFGETVAAIIEPESAGALTEEQVNIFLRDRLAHYKVPKHVEFRDELPREDSGKLFKRRLRDQFWKDSGRKI